MRHGLLVVAVVYAMGASGAAADYQLTILNTNDVHSRFGPVDRWDRDCTAEENAAGACFGGAARLATAIAKARAGVDNVILVDAGDQFPAPSFPGPVRPGLLADLMNRMGYDAMVLGNHEFDEGAEVLRDFVSRLDFPVLMANVDVSREPLLSGLVQRATVIGRGGENLGLIGLTTPDNKMKYAAEPTLDFFQPIDAVRAEIDALKAAGINKIIVLSHCGLYLDTAMAKMTTGIDVIVGGHSHSHLSNNLTPSEGPYPTLVNGVAIVHAFPWGGTLGELRVTFDENGNLVEAVGDQILLDTGVVEDATILSLIAEETAAPE